MTGAERGYLLLCSRLGNPDRKPLTGPQLRKLSQRVRSAAREEVHRDLEPMDLVALGYSQEDALRILSLLSEEALLEYYLAKAKRANCVPITRVSAAYPRALREKLGDDAPGCLWAKGDVSLLTKPRIALVGSRELRPGNKIFAREAGKQAARQGYVLVSGNARGADKNAQNACLGSGGSVIAVVADELESHKPKENMLYLSEDSFDAIFTAQRALGRNAVIHALGEKVLVAQCGLEKGGTWAGTEENLRRGYSPVFCYDDGSEAFAKLTDMGADAITAVQLQDLSGLVSIRLTFL